MLTSGAGAHNLHPARVAWSSAGWQDLPGAAPASKTCLVPQHPDHYPAHTTPDSCFQRFQPDDNMCLHARSKEQPQPGKFPASCLRTLTHTNTSRGSRYKRFQPDEDIVPACPCQPGKCPASSQSTLTTTLPTQPLPHERSWAQVLALAVAAAEFDEVPVRHNEDKVNAALAKDVRWKLPQGQGADDPHAKANLLLQVPHKPRVWFRVWGLKKVREH